MNRQDFYYELPEELIAQEPLLKRDEARLMVVDQKRNLIRHSQFSKIGDFLPPQSAIVLNNSKVIPARLLGYREKSGGQVEVFLLKKLDGDCTYEAMLRPYKKLKNGERILFKNSGIVAEIYQKENRLVRFNRKNITPALKKIGHMPLPPYIKRADRPADHKYYQTVYAKALGSVAAPTAGLHFTKRLINQLKQCGHGFLNVTLHVNLGTFKPVDSQDITKHQMHSEEYSVTSGVYSSLQKSLKKKSKVVAVGTTSCRVLETLARKKCLKGQTDLFIYPGYQFQRVDALITNFHLPYSTLLMLTYAFGGMELMKKAYQEAINERYRFYSYGDSMLILK